ncbi:MAG: NAD-dependent epimerase/dehydratase family protein [Deltaproteobacteria bacterium]|nr:NAD-dependent epimerase/dehydratase family protein [Deltaproteobacteria bacterium]
MKALVIGATGIIGNHVVRSLLDEGIDVRAFSRGVTSSRNLEGLNVELFKGDINDSRSVARAMKGCSWVFHTAPYYPTNTFQRGYHLKMAMAGLENVLKAAELNSIDRLVYTSSLTTIGSPRKVGAIRELPLLADESCAYDLKRPPHPYFEVKFRMEEEVKRRAQMGRPGLGGQPGLGGLPAVIVNPSGCFGPYELKPASLCLIPQLVNRKLPVFVDHPINVVDVADVGRGHVLAARKGKIGDRYILGGHNVTVRWIVETICKLAGVSPPWIKIPIPLALTTAWISEFLSFYLLKIPPFFPILGVRFVQYGEPLDISKAKKELGYAPSPMEECFVRAIDWFRKIGYC